MNKDKKIMKTILFSTRQIEMVELMKEKTGITNFVAIVHFAIHEVFSKMFPAYASNPFIKTPNNIETVAKMKVDKKKLELKYKEELKIKEKINMCTNMLYGEIIDDKFCRFNTYYVNGKIAEQQVPILQVNPIMIETSLFIPNRDVVLENIPELKVKLGIK